MAQEVKAVGVPDTKVFLSSPDNQRVDPLKGITRDHTAAAFYELNTVTRSGRPLRMPAVGLGVYQTRPGPETENAVLAALKHGYRHIDSARIYGNEASVGEAVRKSGIPREEIFVTGKLWNSDHGYDKTLRAVETSLRTFKFDYLDLILIHWPVQGLRLETWRAFEKLQQDGKVRSIGVSNYMVHHLEELLTHCTVKPAVNQIESSPYTTRAAVVDLCKKHNIIVQAYSPLVQGVKFEDPALIALANKYRVTPAQILLRFSLQRGLVILPKSVKEERIKENLNLFSFEISPDDMKHMMGFDENFCTGWDPTDEP